MPESDPLGLSGQVLADKYAVDRAVGSGGFAVVYRAHHKIWNQPVAIKFFSGLSSAPAGQRDALRDAFVKEGALLSELSSQTANIVQARDVGTITTADGQWMPYMVLEWLEGKTLDELMSDPNAPGSPPWSLNEVVRILRPVAGALEIAHQRGIAHRDVKPGNLFVVGSDPRDPRSTLKLLDFGVAKMIDAPLLKPMLAKTGVAVTSFTPQYGAPEQFSRGFGATGPWTDVFALALVAVELVTATAALDGDDVVQLGYSASRPDRRPTPRALGAAIPDAVDQVFAKALSPQPSDRYETAGEFWSALESAAGIVSVGSSLLPSLRTAVDPSSATMVAPSAQVSLGADIARTTEASTTGPVVSSRGQSGGGKRTGLLIGGVVVVAGVALAGFALRGKANGPAPNASSAALAVAPPVASASASAAAVAVPECPPDMAKIPAGEYFMGSEQKDAAPNERPVHHVKLGTYCFDMNEVTMDRYRACSDVGKCRRAPGEAQWPKISDHDRKAYSTACNVNEPTHGNHPVNCVTWDMAERYCRAQDKRLPTEAEWEYAARGPDGRYYPWGDDPPTAKHLNACGKECVAWASKLGMELGALYDADDGYPTTAPVGSFVAGSSRFGPHDVVGNVWEWVEDWFGDYTSTELDNPTGPASGERRVIRGGGWDGRDASWLRPSFRFGQVPDARSPGIGFRCAKSLASGG